MLGSLRPVGVYCVLVALAAGSGACGEYDRGLLDPASGPDADSGRHDDSRDASAAGAHAEPPADAAIIGNDAGPSCRPAPSPTPACPQICDETCNGQDDDCDGDTDEAGDLALCSTLNATSVCIEGSCRLIECVGRYGDCDGDPESGCETSLERVETCGACNRVCEIDRALEGCDEGICAPIGCEPGYGDCDEDDASVCETAVDTVAQCGSCDGACLLDHAVPECRELACAVLRCDNGYGDCDGSADNGCEEALSTLTNCGGCGVGCDKASCAGGVCSAIVCDAPLADCDADGRDCEVDLATDTDPSADPSHCGACNAPCEFGAAVTAHASGLDCLERKCVAVCDAGFGDCDPDYKNGCETAVTTSENCGACGRDCDALLAHTGATRCDAGGVCAIEACAADYEDCDGLAGNGCEQSLRSVTDCGGCSRSGDNEPCTGLPRVTESVCTTGSCEVTVCESGYADCDGASANGCERNTAVEGPCFPDTNCTKRTNGGSDYYFCTNNSTWSAARDKCRTQARGDLVHIDDANENAFVRMHRGADAWIGASDAAIEGLWRWSNDGVPFWRGTGSGTAQLSQYAQFRGGEPSDSGGAEDCGLIYSDGTWNDGACTTALDFVCEVSADLCPADASKIDPGQCGCGVADTDADNDGFAVCNDACPSDPGKLAGGGCGCGVADTNRDGDGALDCNETCDDDPAKVAPGVCGCGVAETNSDGDSTPDCQDGCPFNSGSTSSASGCGLGFVPANVDATRLNPNLADATTVINCNAVLDTSGAAPSFTTWCTGARPQITVQQQPGGGPELAVVALRGLDVNGGRTLTIRGSRPAALVVFGAAIVSGTVDASASGTTGNAGSNFDCVANAAGNSNLNGGDETGGGGGGGFGTAGGRGGDGDDSAGAPGGLTRGNAALVPLLPGCSGGTAGGCSTRGAGGGAFQLSIGGAFTLASTGVLRADGGVGPNTCGGQWFGGAGGGSGGGIRVEAASLAISGTTQANGGKGGDSRYGSGSTAVGAAGSTSSGAPGGNATNRNEDVFGGGGGGGGYGRIVLCNRTTSSGCP